MIKNIIDTVKYGIKIYIDNIRFFNIFLTASLVFENQKKSVSISQSFVLILFFMSTIVSMLFIHTFLCIVLSPLYFICCTLVTIQKFFVSKFIALKIIICPICSKNVKTPSAMCDVCFTWNKYYRIFCSKCGRKITRKNNKKSCENCNAVLYPLSKKYKYISLIGENIPELLKIISVDNENNQNVNPLSKEKYNDIIPLIIQTNKSVFYFYDNKDVNYYINLIIFTINIRDNSKQLNDEIDKMNKMIMHYEKTMLIKPEDVINKKIILMLLTPILYPNNNLEKIIARHRGNNLINNAKYKFKDYKLLQDKTPDCLKEILEFLN